MIRDNEYYENVKNWTIQDAEERGIKAEYEEEMKYIKYVNLFDSDELLQKIDDLQLTTMQFKRNREDIFIKGQLMDVINNLILYIFENTKNESEGK